MAYTIVEDPPINQSMPLLAQDDRSSSQCSLLDKKADFNILEKLKHLRDNKKFCDVTLEVRGVQFVAHKNVLAAWSPTFASKLFPEDTRVHRDYISVYYDNSEVFSDLLDFMYNGYVAPRETNFLQLLHLAVSFQIETLKNYCEEFLRCNLHLENFVSTYFLSRKFKLETLEEYIVGFLQLNLSDAVKQGEFLSLRAEKFNTFLSEGWMKKIKPEIKLFLIISWVGYDVQEREKYLVLLLGHINWSTVANDFLLEINRTENFFTTHESSLYLLLQTLFSAGIALGPYKDAFPKLRETHSAILQEVVHTSLLKIDTEKFYPVLISVQQRPMYRHAVVNTQLTLLPANMTDTEMNTDVNSRHFEESDVVATQPAAVYTEMNQIAYVEPVLPVQTTADPGHERTGKYNEQFETLGEFIEAEIHQIKQRESQERSQKEKNVGQELDAGESLAEVGDQMPVAPAKVDINVTRDKDTIPVTAEKKKQVPNTRSVISSPRQQPIARQEPTKHTKRKSSPKTSPKKNSESNAKVAKPEASSKTPLWKRSSPRRAKKSDKDLVVHENVEETMQTKETEKASASKEVAMEEEEAPEADATEHTDGALEENKNIVRKIKIGGRARRRAKRDRKKSGDSTLEKSAGKALVCDFENCAYITKYPARLEKHVKVAHEATFELKCNLCQFETKEVRKYNSHMKQHFPGPPYKCDHPRCTVSSEKIQPMLVHRSSHTDDRPYSCDCGMRFRTNNTLIAHKKVHLGQKTFRCQECDVSFATQNTLNQHMVTHSDVRPYLCDKCGFSTKFQSHLTAHKRLHTGEVYHCQFPNCVYFSPKRSQLKAHMRAHLGIRAHICNICDKSFVEKSHLTRHMRLHNDSRLTCDHCEYSTTRKDKLKEHVNKHHGVNSNSGTKASNVKVTGVKGTSGNTSSGKTGWVTESIVKTRSVKTSSVKGKKYTNEPVPVMMIAKTKALLRGKVNSAVNDDQLVDVSSPPVMVKWDHGGYSLAQTHEAVTPVPEEGLLSGDTEYCVLRDPLSCNTNDQMHHILSIEQINAQMSAAKSLDTSGNIVPQDSNIVHNMGAVDPSFSHGTVSGPNSSGTVLNLLNSPGLTSVDQSVVTSKVACNTPGQQSYTIIHNSSSPGGDNNQQQEYGGLNAFMAFI